MGRARSFAENALRAIERRQLLVIAVVTGFTASIGVAKALEAPEQSLPRRLANHQTPAFSARVTIIDEEPSYRLSTSASPLITLPARGRPSRIPQIVRSSDFRRRLMLGPTHSSIHIQATAEPQTSIVHLTVRAPSATEAVRIANLAAFELVELSRNENRAHWTAWQRTREAEVAAASQHTPLELDSSGELVEVLEGIRSGRTQHREYSTRHILEKASLSPYW